MFNYIWSVLSTHWMFLKRNSPNFCRTELCCTECRIHISRWHLLLFYRNLACNLLVHISWRVFQSVPLLSLWVTHCTQMYSFILLCWWFETENVNTLPLSELLKWHIWGLTYVLFFWKHEICIRNVTCFSFAQNLEGQSAHLLMWYLLASAVAQKKTKRHWFSANLRL